MVSLDALDPKRLLLLLEVSRKGSLTGAANSLHYTPSAVSQQIAALERELGFAVVERGARGVSLTPPGRALVEHADRIQTELRAAARDLEALSEMRTGTMRLGWFATAGAVLMPRAIASFTERHPEMVFDLIEGDPHELIPLLRSKDLDFALLYRFDEFEPPLPDDLEMYPLLNESLRVGLSLDHPLADRTKLKLTDLVNDRWIQGVRRGPTMGVLPQACRRLGFEPNIAFQTDDRHAVEGLVAAGVGAALIPAITVPSVRRDLAVKSLEPCGLSRGIYAAVAPGAYRPPTADAMLDALTEASELDPNSS